MQRFAWLRDSAETHKAAAFMSGYRSHRDQQEPGQHTMYKNVLLENSFADGNACQQYTDSLARVTWMKANKHA